MNNLKFILACLVCVALSHSVFCQDYKSILEQTWYGGSRSRTDLTESGYFGCKARLYGISYDEYSSSFTGKSSSSFKYDGVTYTSISYIEGKLYKHDNSIVLTSTGVITADDLPNEMIWSHPTIYLTLYNDSDHSGHYLMHGKASNQYYDDEYVAYGTYQY